jgi:FkbM family methyltransferase
MVSLTSAWRLARRVRRTVSPRRTDSLSVRSVGLAILGDERLVAVDVGAAMGLLPHWHLLDGIAQIYQIEPRADACEDLKRENAAAGLTSTRRVLCAAVAGSEGPRTLYVSNVPTGTSILQYNVEAARDCGDYADMNYLFPLAEQQITTQRLSSLMEAAQEQRVDLIKLDIQGAELEALQGLGEQRLGQLLGAELEVGMHDFFPREAGFSAVQSFMEGNELELFDVRVARARRPLAGKDGDYERRVFGVHGNSPTVAARLWEFDVIYFRKKSVLLDRGDAGAIRRMALVYATYNFYSEAHSLVVKAEAAGIFGEDAARELKQAIVDLHHIANYRPWLGEGRFWSALRRIGARLAPRDVPRWCQHMYQSYPHG